MGGPRKRLIARVTRALLPESCGAGLEHSIAAQMVADAIDSNPPPYTLHELLAVLGRNQHHWGGIASELLAAMRRRALELPDMPLEQLAG